jgi:hypothetical protein
LPVERHSDGASGSLHIIIFDQVIELGLRADVRFDPDSDHGRTVRCHLGAFMPRHSSPMGN